MNVVVVTDFLKNKQIHHMTGIKRYAFSLLHFLEADSSIQIQIYNTKKKKALFTAFQKVIKKDFNSVFTSIPVYYPFKKFPAKSIIHLTSQTFAFPLMWQKPKQPIIVTVHDIIPYVCNKYNSIWEKILYYGIVKGLKNATHIITDSEHTKKDLMTFLNINEEKITTIYLGIDPVEFNQKKRIKRKSCTVLYVGSETRRKNIIVLLNALAEVKKQIPQVNLIKIGLPENQSVHEELQAYIKKLDLTENVIWKGYIENLTEEYNTATVFVFPSLYEGFGFPILEAMACGCPVICSNKTSLSELGGNAVLYFDGYDYKLLAVQLLKLFQNDKLQRELQRKGLNQSKRFSWQRCIVETKKVYDTVCLNNKWVF